MLNLVAAESPDDETVLLIVAVDNWMAEIHTQILEQMNLTEVENVHLFAVAVLVVVIHWCYYLGRLFFVNEIEVKQQKMPIAFVAVVKNLMLNQIIDFELNLVEGCLS